MNNKLFLFLSEVSTALGKGLIAGVSGTIAITTSQMIEMKITKRSMSSSPSIMGREVLGVEPKGKAQQEKQKALSGQDNVSEEVQQKVEQNKEKFSMIIHFSYGTSWGIFRGILDLLGVRGRIADLLHFLAVWGTAQVMLPANNLSQPITKWSPSQIFTDILHHAIYASAAGFLYDAMRNSK